eukprot:snap_masked-scaffold_29-processed-gene-1.43-mRNA-1 protein AED:1.00 eAED:1.00 QI:0/-1/0/0/-1/1/1/0/238
MSEDQENNSQNNLIYFGLLVTLYVFHFTELRALTSGISDIETALNNSEYVFLFNDTSSILSEVIAGKELNKTDFIKYETQTTNLRGNSGRFKGKTDTKPEVLVAGLKQLSVLENRNFWMLVSKIPVFVIVMCCTLACPLFLYIVMFLDISRLVVAIFTLQLVNNLQNNGVEQLLILRDENLLDSFGIVHKTSIVVVAVLAVDVLQECVGFTLYNIATLSHTDFSYNAPFGFFNLWIYY